MRGRSWALAGGFWTVLVGSWAALGGGAALCAGALGLLGGSWTVLVGSWAALGLLKSRNFGTLEVSKFWVMVPVLLVSGKFGHN